VKAIAYGKQKENGEGQFIDVTELVATSAIPAHSLPTFSFDVNGAV
jgi:hypothetical protein